MDTQEYYDDLYGYEAASADTDTSDELSGGNPPDPAFSSWEDVNAQFFTAR